MRVCGFSPPLPAAPGLALGFAADGRRKRMMAVLSSLWLSVESAATASSVIVGMSSSASREAVDVLVACERCEIRGVVIWLMCVGDCQNST